MYIGIVLAVILFIFFAMRGVSIFLAALLCTMLVVVTNGLPLDKSIFDYFAFGPLGAFSFAGKFFLLFVMGAMFGRVTGESGAASSIAVALVNKLGAQKALWITVLAATILTYGGVVVFVVIFAMYPLGIKLLQQANIPKRLFIAALALGSGTYTLSALPGTPSIQNVIAAVSLKTDLFAAGGYGIFSSLIMFGFGMLYLEKQRKKALANNEGFHPTDRDLALMSEDNTDDLPHWGKAIIPLLIVIGTIITPRLITAFGYTPADDSIILYALKQPLLWPSISLLFGIITTIIIFPKLHKNTLVTVGKGADDAIIPLIATAVVIGFGSVVTKTDGFISLSQWLLSLDFNPLLSIFVSVSLISAIVGSSTGGLQIFLSSMSESYLDKGVEPEMLHRVATMASGGFDSLPHCGAVVAVLAIAGLTHKEGYKDIGIVTVVIPVFATLASIGIYSIW
ncbi:MAG: GntP family permease [Cognaticolwellia sp.]|jgi:H+/gluconate symporter-like permease